MKQKILVMGATGCMGYYLVPELLKLGFKVDAISMDEMSSDNPDLRYYKFNCFDDNAMSRQLSENRYDGIVDFMHYDEQGISKRLPLYLENTDHYIFLSSYRVYANEEVPVTEKAPHILDVTNDEKFLSSENYALQKSMGERVLQNAPTKNWTILRPVIIFSNTRFPLINLETATVLNRASKGKTVLFPSQAKNVNASMMWGGDAAKLIARLLLKKNAMGECFTVATGESVTWSEYVSYFEEFFGLKAAWIDKEEHLKIMSTDPEIQLLHRWGLEYDRLYDRVIDNSKILAVTGLKKEDFKTIKEALRYELDRVSPDKVWEEPKLHIGVSDRMEAYAVAHGM